MKPLILVLASMSCNKNNPSSISQTSSELSYLAIYWYIFGRIIIIIMVQRMTAKLSRRANFGVNADKIPQSHDCYHRIYNNIRRRVWVDCSMHDVRTTNMINLLGCICEFLVSYFFFENDTDFAVSFHFYLEDAWVLLRIHWIGAGFSWIHVFSGNKKCASVGASYFNIPISLEY